MVVVAIIQQRGKVEYLDVHVDSRGLPPRYLRFARLTRPVIASPYQPDVLESATSSLVTVDLEYHRMVGFSVEIAYWHKTWLDNWAIEDLLRWEGREYEAENFHEYNDRARYIRPETFYRQEPSRTPMLAIEERR